MRYMYFASKATFKRGRSTRVLVKVLLIQTQIECINLESNKENHDVPRAFHSTYISAHEHMFPHVKWTAFIFEAPSVAP